MQRKRRRFTTEQKAEAVRLVESVGNLAQVSRDLDIDRGTLKSWVRQAEIDAGRGPHGALTTEERGELQALRREVRTLRMERDFPKKSRGLLRQGQRSAFELIEAEQANFPVGLMWRVLGVARSGLYAWRRRPAASKRRADDARLASRIRKVHELSRRTYGSPRVHAELRAEGGRVARKRVERLMRENGLFVRVRRRYCRTTNSNHAYPIAPNVLNRSFEAERPNQVWVTDITYIPTQEGWLYLAVVEDLFSRRIVGWSMADHLRTELVSHALEMAIGNRFPEAGLLHHSDRGCQYASAESQELLRSRGLICSMSRRANCLDNAVAESFLGTLKRELVARASWTSRSSARAAIHEYVKVFYNRQRRHSHNGYLSPVDYELKFLAANAA